MSTPADKIRATMSVRDFEHFLQRRGFTRTEARGIITLGFRAWATKKIGQLPAEPLQP